MGWVTFDFESGPLRWVGLSLENPCCARVVITMASGTQHQWLVRDKALCDALASGAHQYADLMGVLYRALPAARKGALTRWGLSAEAKI